MSLEKEYWEIANVLQTSSPPLRGVNLRVYNNVDNGWIIRVDRREFAGMRSELSTQYMQWLARVSRTLYEKHNLSVTVEKV